MNIYLQLTEEFNDGRLRAILSSGQAVVLHRLAIMSKDGDWILREDEESTQHVLGVLAKYGARYRFGAPLDTRWLTGGWSAHFEFHHQQLRVRTDFVTRPARVAADHLALLWERNASANPPVVDLATLVDIKKTNREKDYVVIGELARRLPSPREQLLCSRSAKDLAELAAKHPDLTTALVPLRPLLAKVDGTREQLESALDAERRALMHANEERLSQYMVAAEGWSRRWPSVQRQLDGLPLLAAHEQIVAEAEQHLPFTP